MNWPPSEETLRLLEVISAIASTAFGAAAAWAGFAAVIVARRALTDQRKGAEVAAKDSYYRALVSDQALDRLTSFAAFAREEIRAAQRDVADLGQQVQMNIVDGRLRAVAGSLQDAILGIREHLQLGLRAWGDEQLLERCTAALDSLQDDTVEALSGLALGRAGAEQAILLLVEMKTAEVMNVVRSAHPTLAATQIQSIP